VDLPELKEAVDAELYGFLQSKQEALPENADLIDELWEVISSGGKRLRPAFAYWGYRAAGGSSEKILRTAAALELLHTFAIVHDDVMDAAPLRRGRATVHARRGTSAAILVGDLALVLADDAFLSTGFASHLTERAFVLYSRMRQEVIAGQHLDLKNAAAAETSVEEARRVAVLKSGRYSVAKPLMIGAALGEGTEQLIRGLEEFGEPVGEAFQMRDDILGLFGDPKLTGKTVDGDIREGKRHVLYARTASALTGDDREFFTGRWGAEDLGPEEIERLRSLVESSGSHAAVEALCEQLLLAALEKLKGLEISEESRAALKELARLSTQRVA
jgi:geranylgeranyl diphosphate synthase type I